MQLDKLKREHPNKKSRLVGRGGTRGKTSGRGGKGQTARAGNKRRPQLRDIIKKIPKLRGYRFKSFAPKYIPVNLDKLNIFGSSEIVNPVSLFNKGIVKKFGGVIPEVKILGTGELKNKIEIEGCFVSKGARAKIEKLGGVIR